MESFRIENLTFTYPNQKKPALENISFSVNKGEFLTICGKSGCGKSTLLRMLKPSLTPHGECFGSILFENKNINLIDIKDECLKIGFVLQNPENQIVTDKVWHELAFGLENLGLSTSQIRSRVAETATFFGIEDWFHKKTSELSGGQKQLLNLASVMVMCPSVLILDEPTSQLDPISAKNFLETLSRLNRETGITVMLSEHRLEDAFPMSDRIIVLEDGKIICNETPQKTGMKLTEMKNDMAKALPTPIKVFSALNRKGDCPVTVRDGRIWLESISGEIKVPDTLKEENNSANNPVISFQDVWLRYDKNEDDVLKNLSFKVNKGELYAILGGNGAGKTTALSVAASLLKPYRGKAAVKGKIAMLPQNPKSLFVKSTLILDLYDIFEGTTLSQSEKDSMVKSVFSICELEELTQRNPYDLSGGELQRAAIAKILLTNPDIILLDEPTKGLDAHFKEDFANILFDLKNKGITIVMVSHDIEFCAMYADRCALLFDGMITSEGEPKTFFAGKSFYTTAANRMARNVLPYAVTANDIVSAFGVKPKNHPHKKTFKTDLPVKIQGNKDKHLSFKNIVWGTFFALMFLLTYFLFNEKFTDYRNIVYQFSSIVLMFMALYNFIPKKGPIKIHPSKMQKTPIRTAIFSLAVIFIAVPATILFGMYALDDRKYLIISLIIIFETILPIILAFENRKPDAKEIIIISVLCATAIAGRTFLASFPQFKPALAVIIISGICFGSETGFLVGAVTAFVSNFFFGQGPWTPWQMLANGAVGFISGVIFKRNLIPLNRINLCIYGFISAVVIFGGIVNPSSVLMWYPKPTLELIITSYAAGFMFDAIHGIATSFFLYFAAKPMIEKIERIKTKHGI